MNILDLTLSTPQENLALEEALLEWAETNQQDCLRFWESPDYFVVMGAGSPIHTDVNLTECAARNIPVLRRCSGGGTVLQGPGCLNYTLILDRQAHHGLDSISAANETVLQKITRALAACGIEGISMQGYSDLTAETLKFSGNAQRRRKQFILYHGTILHDFDLPLIPACLGTPEKMPDYRSGRPHSGFVANIRVNPKQLRQEIAAQWNADTPLIDWPAGRTKELARTKYADQQWIMSI